MKKALLLFFILFKFAFCHAQNYQCLQAGVKHYFTNGNGYLRGIRIDSVRTIGSSSFYYPFHTLRGDYEHSYITPLDSNGGSWLGKRVEQMNDGTFLFDNIWQDTITVNTQAQVGDSWIFYNDTTTQYYKATVVAHDTMTVLGSVDSVKTLRINAYNSAGIDPLDSINNFEIKLSKNNGFVQVFDLYTFPYHRPDTAYQRGSDFYLDFVSVSDWCWLPPTMIFANETFRLIQLINPTYTQLYDWNIGDVFEYSTFKGTIPNDGTYPCGYHYDSITSKIITPGIIQYGYIGWEAKMHIHPFALYSGSYNPSLPRPYDTFTTTGILTFNNSLLIDTTMMPEEYSQKFLWYYYPDDTSFCRTNNKYKSVQVDPTNYGILCSEAAPLTQIYKTDIGLLKYNWNILGGSPPLIQDTTLIYFVKNGIPCGRYTYPDPINYLAGVNEFVGISFSISPNPATTQLTVKTTNTLPYTITLQNMLGQTMQTLYSTKQEQTIDVSNVPAGVYNVSITDESGNRHNEKVVIMH